VPFFSVFNTSFVCDPGRAFSNRERRLLRCLYPFLILFVCLWTDLFVVTWYLLKDLNQTKRLGLYLQLREMCEAVFGTSLQIGIAVWLVTSKTIKTPPHFWIAIGVSLVDSVHICAEADTRWLSISEHRWMLSNLGMG